MLVACRKYMIVNMSKIVAPFLFLHYAFFQVNCKLVDMSFSYESDMIIWPGTPSFNLTLQHRGPYKDAPFALAFNMKLSEHLGTHIDAPVHFAEGKPTVDQIPPESLICEAIVLNITEQTLNNRDYAVTVNDLITWETKHGRIPDRSILFLLTGLGKYWGDYEKYMGAKEEDDTLHFPGFHKDAAQWLVDNRNISGIGTDARSFDVGSSTSFPAHQTFLGNNLYGLESVANIELLPVKGAKVYVMPMKIKGGSGGPTRIFAQTDPTGRCSYHTPNIAMAFITILFKFIFMFNK